MYRFISKVPVNASSGTKIINATTNANMLKRFGFCFFADWLAIYYL